MWRALSNEKLSRFRIVIRIVDNNTLEGLRVAWLGVVRYPTTKLISVVRYRTLPNVLTNRLSVSFLALSDYA